MPGAEESTQFSIFDGFSLVDRNTAVPAVPIAPQAAPTPINASVTF